MFAAPHMTCAAVFEILRPLRNKQMLTTLGTFDHGTRASEIERAIGTKLHDFLHSRRQNVSSLQSLQTVSGGTRKRSSEADVTQVTRTVMTHQAFDNRDGFPTLNLG